MQSVSVFAGIAVGTDVADDRVLRGGLQSELLHAGIALLILLIIQILNVLKPRGLTPYGWRKQQEQRKTTEAANTVESINIEGRKSNDDRIRSID